MVVDDSKELLVTKCLASRRTVAQPKWEQRSNLVQKAPLHHVMHPQADSIIEICTIQGQLHGRIHRFEGRHRCGERLPG